MARSSAVETSTSLFSEAEREMIRQAVAQAEKKSSGEIVAMVVPHSDRYLEAEKLGALLLAALVALILAIVFRHVTIWTYIPAVCILFFPTLLLLRRFPKLKLSFAGPRRQAEAVRERALASFYEKGLYRTRDATGILIFVSLLERKVWILGDRGINEKIQPGYWNNHARDLARGIRKGEGAQALCRVIASCGDELARHFPRRSDDSNELPDEIVITER